MSNEFYSVEAAKAGDGLDEFTAAYIMCMYFTDSCDWDFWDDEESDRREGQFDVEDVLSEEALNLVKTQCEEFQKNADLARCYEEFPWYGPDRAGHDFWLTRNHHGAGFWDRGLGELGKKLTQAAHDCGGCDAYRGDDEKVYIQ